MSISTRRSDALSWCRKADWRSVIRPCRPRIYPAMTLETPPAIATEAFTDANAAVGRLEEIYERNTKFLRDRFEAYAQGGALAGRVRACYPFVRITTATYARLDS